MKVSDFSLTGLFNLEMAGLQKKSATSVIWS
jgi:hypothetical protein